MLSARSILPIVVAWVAVSAGSVHLEPEGLRPSEGAMLTIESAKGTDAERELVLLPLTRWHQSIKPRLTAAETNEAALDAAAAEYGAWLDEVALQDRLLAVEHEIAEAKASLAKAVTNAAQNSLRRCVENRDPSELQTMQRLYRYAGRFQLTTVAPLLQTNIGKAARFELEFFSTILNVVAAPGATSHDTFFVRARVKLTYDPQRGTLSGSGPLEYRTYSHKETVAGIETSTAAGQAGSTFRVLTGTLRLGRSGIPAASISLTIDPGRPKEFTQVTGLGLSFVDTTSAWRNHWEIFHTREEVNPDDGVDQGPWIIRGWTRSKARGEFEYFFKRYSGPLQLEPPYPIEDTSLDLRYTPAP